MKKRLAFSIILIFLIQFVASAQTQVTGRVIDYFDLTTIPDVQIHKKDSLVIGKTDVHGNFSIELPAGEKEILVSFIGMEWMHVQIPDGCRTVEVIMIPDGTYDYISAKKINKKRLKVFKQLLAKHELAFRKGIFTKAEPCSSYTFIEY